MRPAEICRSIATNSLLEGEFDPALNAIDQVVDVDRSA
jgi:hypothetical protein